MKKTAYFKKGFDQKILQAAFKKWNLEDVILMPELESFDVPWGSRIIGEVVEKTRAKDIIIIDEIETLGKTALEWLEVLSAIFSTSAHLYIIDNEYVLKSPSRHGHWSFLLLSIAEKERDLISRRAKIAIAKKRDGGGSLGRPPGKGNSLCDKHREEIEMMLKSGVTQRFIAKKIGVQPATLSYWMKKVGIR